MRKILLALALLVLPASAQAFSSGGHKLIAKLAYQRLTPQAKHDVDTLLALASQQGTPQCPVSRIDSASTWADCVRDKQAPQFVDLVHHEKYGVCVGQRVKNPCPDGKCLSAQTEDALRTLRNSSGATVQRLQALEVVVHFLGDMHQPLHTTSAYGSTGRNIKVSYPGEAPGAATLHGIWDRELVSVAVDAQHGGQAALKDLMDRKGAAWSRGTPEDWVHESRDVAVRSAYAPLGLDGCGSAPTAPVTITQAYIEQAAKVEQIQIAKAASRLAGVLNDALH